MSLAGAASLADRVLAGDARAASRLMRNLDDRIASAQVELRRLHAHTGRAFVLGITGNPGAGKSTVVDALIERYRAGGKRVGVVAVDPTSPFSGGAILGDRIRMQRHATDEGVFIRSLATRGHLGGLSRSTCDVVAVLDAMGFDIVIIETVGVGQDEIEIVSQAHAAVVVTVPGLGDDIQAIKAGLLEIADVLVVNKADREGVDRTVRDLLHMLELRGTVGNKDVEIIKTIAPSGSGIDELVAAVERHRTSLAGAKGVTRAKARLAARIADLVKEKLAEKIERVVEQRGGFDALAAEVLAGTTDPYAVSEEVVEAALDSRSRT